MSISIKRIKNRNVKKWNKRIEIAHDAPMSLSNYQSLMASMKESDDHSRAMKKSKGQEIKAWEDLTPFLSSCTASLPIYPKGYKKNVMFRMVKLEEMISELTEDEFYYYKAIILQRQEHDHELAQMIEFFESKITL